MGRVERVRPFGPPALAAVRAPAVVELVALPWCGWGEREMPWIYKHQHHRPCRTSPHKHLSPTHLPADPVPLLLAPPALPLPPPPPPLPLLLPIPRPRARPPAAAPGVVASAPAPAVAPAAFVAVAVPAAAVAVAAGARSGGGGGSGGGGDGDAVLEVFHHMRVDQEGHGGGGACARAGKLSGDEGKRDRSATQILSPLRPPSSPQTTQPQKGHPHPTPHPSHQRP